MISPYSGLVLRPVEEWVSVVLRETSGAQRGHEFSRTEKKENANACFVHSTGEGRPTKTACDPRFRFTLQSSSSFLRSRRGASMGLPVR